MARKLRETLASVGVASVAGVALGYVLDNLSLGLAMGAALPILSASRGCPLAR